MALIACPECNAQVSTKAKACPSCGAKPAAKTRVWLLAMLILPAMFVTWAVLRTPSVEEDAMLNDRYVIEQCWKDQQRKSNTPGGARSIAAMCENFETAFKAKYGRTP